jgi:hypothetical protein
MLEGWEASRPARIDTRRRELLDGTARPAFSIVAALLHVMPDSMHERMSKHEEESRCCPEWIGRGVGG